MENLIGKKFGRWAVISPAPRKNRYRYVFCQCECGTKKEVSLDNLKAGKSKSCGCLSKEVASETKFKHGLGGTPLYLIWQSMLNRCRSPKVKAYKNYGGRGIRVCHLWENDFMVFRRWAIRNGYKKGLSLDRVDNDGDYCPENCRWATYAEQKRNTRASLNIMNKETGETFCAMDWSIKLKGSPNLVSRRISSGWDNQAAISTPPIR